MRNLNKEEEKKIEEKEEKLKEKELEEEEEKELDLKKRALNYFLAIIIGIISIGAMLFFFLIKTTEPSEIIASNITNENITTTYIEAYKNIQIARMGFFMILLLTLGILGFVGSMYLAHPTKWSKEMIKKGRTVEYITVILIIGAVLTLGLLGTIGTETIGTILAAIAGYVLGKAVTPKEEAAAPKGG